MKYNRDGIIELRNAIVVQVAKDYMFEKKYVLTHANKPCMSHRMELDIITKFLLSDRFEMLDTGIAGDAMIKRLDEMVIAGLEPTRHLYKEKG